MTLAGNSIVVNGESLPNEQYSVNGGGAIYQYGNRTSIVNSTLSGNTAQLPLSTRSGGGALMDNGNSSFITNSTFSGNSVSFDEAATEPDSNGGGAINYTQERDGVVLANVTIAGNSAEGAAGGALVPTGGTDVRVGNSMIAGNRSSVVGASECALTSGGSPEATVTSLGYNLSDDPDDSCGLDAPGDLTAAPGIGPLAANGGPTQTRALLEGSAAIDAGNPNGCLSAYGLLLATDQRGFSRPSPAGSRCDIGAFELQVETPDVPKVPVLGTLQVNGPRKVKRTARVSFTVKIRNVGEATATSLRFKARGRGAHSNRWIGQLAAGQVRSVRLPIRFWRRGRSKVTFTALSFNAGKKAVKRTVRVR